MADGTVTIPIHWLFGRSERRRRATEVMTLVPHLISRLPELNADLVKPETVLKIAVVYLAIHCAPPSTLFTPDA